MGYPSSSCYDDYEMVYFPTYINDVINKWLIFGFYFQLFLVEICRYSM